MVEKGWVKRTSPADDRRVALIEVTPVGKATLARVRKAAEAHLAERLAILDAPSRQSLQAGLGVLRRVFGAPPAPARIVRTDRTGSASVPSKHGHRLAT